MKQDTIDRMKRVGLSFATARKILAQTCDSASVIREIWDYRNYGLTVRQARQLLSRVPIPRYRAADRQRYDNRYCDCPVQTPRIDEYISTRDQRRHNLEAMPPISDTWSGLNDALRGYRHGYSRAVKLPSGKIVAFRRREIVTWPSRYKAGQWPESTQVSYTATLYSVEYDLIKSVCFDRRGSWLPKTLKALGLVRVRKSKSLPGLQQNPLYRLSLLRKIGPVKIYARTLAGITADFVAVHGKISYHADSQKSAISGLKQKIICQKSDDDPREILSVQKAIKKWGMCKTGLLSFCDEVGLSYDTKISRQKLRKLVTENIRDRFSNDLAIAHI